MTPPIIIVLQFAPELGKVDANITKANHLISTSKEVKDTLKDPNRSVWLHLPEMCFSGYNFRDLAHIEPYLEPHIAGPSTRWAQELARARHWHITVGYPELGPTDINNPSSPKARYNSTVTIGPEGQVLAHYRKRFLYYTDETWASEGNNATGFFAGEVGQLGGVSMGICMDLNPYRFGPTSQDWNRFEFASHVLQHQSPLAVVNMAWLTRLTPQEVAELPLRPDQETFTYWIERLDPLRRPDGQKTVVVCANRCGVEGNLCYAGTSAVILFKNGTVSVYDILGKMEEKCLVVDLAKGPNYVLHTANGQS